MVVGNGGPGRRSGVEGVVEATSEAGAVALESEGSPDDGGEVVKKRELGNGVNSRRERDVQGEKRRREPVTNMEIFISIIFL
jgi:hypothetical protein